MDGAETSVGVDVGEHPFPTERDGGEIFFARQDAVVHTPGHGVEVEGGAGDFRMFIGGGVEEAGAPESVFALHGEKFVGDLLQAFYVESAARIFLWQVFENADETGFHPTVAA